MKLFAKVTPVSNILIPHALVKNTLPAILMMFIWSELNHCVMTMRRPNVTPKNPLLKCYRPMKNINWNDYSLETQAIRAGHKRTHEDEHSMPIFATSSYVFKNAEEAALRFTGQKPGNIYSRFTNPTVNAM